MKRERLSRKSKGKKEEKKEEKKRKEEVAWRTEQVVGYRELDA